MNATWLAGVALAATSLVIAVLAPIKKAGGPEKEAVVVSPMPEVAESTVDSGSERLGTSGMESKSDVKEDDSVKDRDFISRG